MSGVDGSNRAQHSRPRWLELADGVFARRYAELDQTLGLVVGQQRCLVVDTGRDEVHGGEFTAAIREITRLPWTVVITHAHFDHFFGTAAFGECPVLAHARCRDSIAADADAQRAEWVQTYVEHGKAEFADALARARVVLPTDVLHGRTSVDLGGRVVEVIHPGRGHTAHDVIVHVPDSGVVFAGDLVEEGAPPSVGSDAYPAEWPHALEVLLGLNPAVVVPGHGDPVDPAFVHAQRTEILSH